MTSYESVSSETKHFLNEFNQLLRIKGFYINFHDGTLYSTSRGYLGALEDVNSCLTLLEENTGEVLYESEINDSK